MAARSPEIEVVLAQFDAYNERDLDRTLGYYSDSAVVRDAGRGRFREEGRDAVRAAYRKVFDTSPGLHAEAAEIFQVGQWVTVHSVAQGFMGTGPGSDREWVEVYRVEDGLITELSLFS